MKSLFGMLGASMIVLLAACQRPSAETSAPPVSPGTVVGGFFSSYRGDFRQADGRFLSSALAAALQSAVQGEKDSAALVKASEFPNDKPLILEGEIFSGLYEGFTGHEVIAEKIADGQASVQVRFHNKHYNVSWTDEVVLVDENGWKIDDIRYTEKKAGLLGLREVLQEFEGALAAEAASTAKS